MKNLDQDLIKACKIGQVEIVRLLIENGADVNTDGDHALCTASSYGHLEVVRLLLDNGAGIDSEDVRALGLASRGNHLEVTKLLLERGVDVNADGGRMLMVAIYFGHLEMVRLLLSFGANIYLCDRFPPILVNKYGYGMRFKCRQGQFGMPGVRSNYALEQALYLGHSEIADLLKSHLASTHHKTG